MQLRAKRDEKRFGTAKSALTVLLAAGVATLGCGGGGASSGALLPPPPPPSVMVTVTPPSGSVVLGNQTTFTATVSNATDTSVSWRVNGIAGGSAAVGTITPAGVYTAPADLPSPATVQVTATSHTDSTKSATANVTVTSDITLTLTPNSASVELGATQAFHATVTSNGHPDTTVRWSVSGSPCSSGAGPSTPAAITPRPKSFRHLQTQR